MDPFVSQLAELCLTQPTRAKWVLAPTHAIGRTLGDRLVLEGTNWANLRFATPLDIALRMGARLWFPLRCIPQSAERGGSLFCFPSLASLPRMCSGLRTSSTIHCHPCLRSEM